MKKRAIIWGVVGFVFTSILGVILHFLYGWLGEAIWIAPFSGVNESTWEHMKLLFWPMLLFAAIENFFLGNREDFWCIKLRSISLGLVLIPLLFYTYNGVIGKSPDFINIAIFFISAAVAYIYETRLFIKKIPVCQSDRWAVVCLSIIALLFIIFTFKTPSLEIFRDGITGRFGIE